MEYRVIDNPVLKGVMVTIFVLFSTIHRWIAGISCFVITFTATRVERNRYLKAFYR